MRRTGGAGHDATSRFTADDTDFTLLNRSTDYGTFAEAHTFDSDRTVG
ncbi:hypothetical protein ACFC0D_02455 [Streptomyces sp. NPDC056222]